MTQRDQDIIRMYQGGMSLREVGYEVGLSYPRIGQILEKHGVQRRSEMAMGWQPIETAPRDGRSVLLWLGAPWSKCEKGRWYEPWANWQAGIIPHDPAREEMYGIGSSIPTHWMPLPEKPLAPVK